MNGIFVHTWQKQMLDTTNINQITYLIRFYRKAQTMTKQFWIVYGVENVNLLCTFFHT